MKDKYGVSINIAQLVKRVRQKLNMSQEVFGKELGVAKSTISLYESGYRVPTTIVFCWLLERDGQVVFYETDCPTCMGSGVITTTTKQ